jgi:SAM-dependent methyltransferase
VGLEAEDLRTIMRALPLLERRQSLLVLGDAVVHPGEKEVARIAADERFDLAPLGGAPDPFTLGAALGFQKTQTLDANGRASLTLDLHEQPPAELHGAFDCVIDAGVLFWCSDPGAALRSIYTLTRPGGLAIHICALTGHYGRGYYDVHPLLFEDFYLGNGGELLEWTARTKHRARGLGRLVPVRLRRANSVSRRQRPGQVYLQDAGPRKIEFGENYPAGGEPNVVPNNVLGVYVFRKNGEAPPRMPLRTEPYRAGER